MLGYRIFGGSGLAVFCLLLLFLTFPENADAKTQASATELSENAEKQVALLVRAARRSNDQSLAPKTPDAKPFWVMCLPKTPSI
ncbi:hypothetical protein LP7551_04723 [Roseibium album]|nr:hypothetical protein LP7551_04723 [Roseibium album]